MASSGSAAIRAGGLLLKCCLRWLAALEVSMADFHETSAAKAYSTIDTAGWLFVAFVVGITAVAAMLAYNGSDTAGRKPSRLALCRR
jgi:hypothetical protein